MVGTPGKRGWAKAWLIRARLRRAKGPEFGYGSLGAEERGKRMGESVHEVSEMKYMGWSIDLEPLSPFLVFLPPRVFSFDPTFCGFIFARGYREGESWAVTR